LLPKDKIASIGIKKKTPILILSLLLFSVLPVPSALKSLSEIDQLNKKVELQEKELKKLENILTEQELKNTNLNFSIFVALKDYILASTLCSFLKNNFTFNRINKFHSGYIRK
jgi:preprotein translocase subunit SecA